MELSEQLCQSIGKKIMTNKKILLIDDEDDIREIAQLSIEMLVDWEVLTAACAQEGLRLAIANQPDVILLDVMMPDLDGLATFAQLQSNPLIQKIPVILLTAKVKSNEQQIFAEIGVKGVITKPFDPLTLAEQVAKILGWKIGYN